MKEIMMKFKPVYNFQSVEYEMLIDLENNESLNEAFDLFDKVLTGLQAIAPEVQKVQQVASKSATPKEDMATPSQINFLVGLGVPEEEAKSYTKKRASMKIKELA